MNNAATTQISAMSRTVSCRCCTRPMRIPLGTRPPLLCDPCLDELASDDDRTASAESTFQPRLVDTASATPNPPEVGVDVVAASPCAFCVDPATKRCAVCSKPACGSCLDDNGTCASCDAEASQ